MNVTLVGCSSQKREEPALAQDLYTSPLFRMARSWAEQNSDEWLILSAKHGLLHPHVPIEPYDQMLHARDAKTWGLLVAECLRFHYAGRGPVTFTILAGARYREYLVPRLITLGFGVDVPMEGMQIGEQLSWLRDQLREVQAA